MPRLIAVTNAGPLIYLSLLGQLPLLRDLFAEILLPDAVYEEVVLHGRGLPGANETKAAVEEGWLRQVAVQNRALVDALFGELDVGEAETLALARELGLGSHGRPQWPRQGTNDGTRRYRHHRRALAGEEQRL